MNRAALLRAISLIGSQAKLASMVGVGQSAVANWLARGRIPPDTAKLVEDATGGRVLLKDLCPTLFVKPRNARRVPKK